MDKKTVVVYKSKYGSTRQYAQWVASDLNADLIDLDNIKNVSQLSEYQTIIFGSYIRIGKIVTSDFISKNWEDLKDKSIILFSVSGANPDNPEIKEYYNLSLPPEIRSKIRFFSFWGHHPKLNFADNLLTSFPKMIYYVNLIFRPNDESIKKMGQMFSTSNHVDKKYIKPLVDYVKSINKK